MKNIETLFYGKKILIIDDEPQMRKLLKLVFSKFELKIFEAKNKSEAIEISKSYLPDLVLLDLNVGSDSGFDILIELRNWCEKPIIIVSVENTSENIVRGLQIGADDYIVKPFDTNELIARASVCLRRSFKKEIEKPILTFQHLTFHPLERKIFINQNEIHLTTIEFELLKLFTKNPDKILTHRHILKEVWGPSNVEHHDYPRVYVRHLRKKIEIDADNPTLILTEPGIGYRFKG